MANFYIDPWAGIKAYDTTVDRLERASDRYEANQDRRIARDIRDYDFQRRQELDQTAVPLAKAISELQSMQTASATNDQKIGEAIKSVVSRGILDPSTNEVVRDINNPLFLKGLSEYAKTAEPQVSARIVNQIVPELAKKQFVMNIDNPEVAVQYAQQAGLRSIQGLEKTPEGKYRVLFRNEQGQVVPSENALSGQEVSTFMTGLMQKNKIITIPDIERMREDQQRKILADQARMDVLNINKQNAEARLAAEKQRQATLAQVQSLANEYPSANPQRQLEIAAQIQFLTGKKIQPGADKAGAFNFSTPPQTNVPTAKPPVNQAGKGAQLSQENLDKILREIAAQRNKQVTPEQLQEQLRALQFP